jgi:phosphoserine phosphatase RsbU/P
LRKRLLHQQSGPIVDRLVPPGLLWMNILIAAFSDYEEGLRMNKGLDKWRAGLFSAYPSASSPYWRALPLGRMKKLLVGVFFITAGVGFAVDLFQIGHPPLAHGLFWPVFGGAMAASIFAARIKRPRLALFVWLFMVVLAGIAYRTASTSGVSLPDGLNRRVGLDAVGIWVGVGVGFRFLLSFVTTEGLDSVRMQTELALAHGIQATLVPTISFLNANFEAYGKSLPSAAMGGDLIDVIESNENLLVYVADVSGHGLAAGQLMGMLKTAMRVSLQFRQSPAALLESADRVLPAVKEPDMYATLALLQFDDSAQVEYALAGHVPILHYRDCSRDTALLSMEQFPLGLIPGGCYASQRVSYSSRDLFLMLTDGVSEVPNARDEEFGLARLEQLLIQHSAEPLPEIWERIMERVLQHGLQQDDQTLLLVRVRH